MICPKFYLPVVLIEQEFLNIWGDRDPFVNAFGQLITSSLSLYSEFGAHSRSDLPKPIFSSWSWAPFWKYKFATETNLLALQCRWYGLSFTDHTLQPVFLGVNHHKVAHYTWVFPNPETVHTDTSKAMLPWRTLGQLPFREPAHAEFCLEVQAVWKFVLPSDL